MDEEIAQRSSRGLQPLGHMTAAPHAPYGRPPATYSGVCVPCCVCVQVGRDRLLANLQNRRLLVLSLLSQQLRDSIQNRPKSTRIGQNRPKLARIGQKSAEIGQNRPKSARNRPKSGKIGRNRPKLARDRPKSVPHHTSVNQADFGRFLANFGRFRPILVDFGRFLADFGRFWPILDRITRLLQ